MPHDDTITISNPAPDVPHFAGTEFGDTGGELGLELDRLRATVAVAHAEAVDAADARVEATSWAIDVRGVGQRVRVLALTSSD